MCVPTSFVAILLLLLLYNKVQMLFCYYYLNLFAILAKGTVR